MHLPPSVICLPDLTPGEMDLRRCGGTCCKIIAHCNFSSSSTSPPKQQFDGINTCFFQMHHPPIKRHRSRMQVSFHPWRPALFLTPSNRHCTTACS